MGWFVYDKFFLHELFFSEFCEIFQKNFSIYPIGWLFLKVMNVNHFIRISLHCAKYARIRVFPEPYFPVWSSILTSQKTRILAYFTQLYTLKYTLTYFSFHRFIKYINATIHPKTSVKQMTLITIPTVTSSSSLSFLFVAVVLYILMSTGSKN